MITYPQFASGMVSQFPIRKHRKRRTVLNRAADGSSIRLADPPGDVTEWVLEYSELSDDELVILWDFFVAAAGRLNGFTFLDPTANLLAWSEELGNAVWQRDPLLSAVPGTGLWHLINSGGGPQAISQTISAPGDYLYSFSTQARADGPVEVTMAVGGNRVARAVSGNWSKHVLTARGAAGAESVTFSLELPAGATVDIRGLQAEAQPAASVCKPSGRGGVYGDARFGEDALAVITTGPNRHSCTVKIIHVNHL